MSAPVAPQPPTVVVVNQANGPGCLVRGIWFLLIGLWAGGIVTLVAYALVVSIIGLPIGLMLLNRLPKIMTLRPSQLHTNVVTLPNGQLVVQQSSQPQRSMLVRTIWFILVGWWFTGIWLGAAWGLTAITFGLGLPFAFWMFNRVGAVTTLARQ